MILFNKIEKEIINKYKNINLLNNFKELYYF